MHNYKGFYLGDFKGSLPPQQKDNLFHKGFSFSALCRTGGNLLYI